MTDALRKTFEQMDGPTIRKLLVEGEVYLRSLAYDAFVSLLKASVGLKLNTVVPGIQPGDIPTLGLEFRVEGAAWKDAAKLIALAGSALDTAGVEMTIEVANVPGRETRGFITCRTFHPAFEFLIGAGGEQAYTTQDVLSLVEPQQDIPDVSNQ